MQSTRDAFDHVFGAAAEMAGALPPYEMDIEREYVSAVRLVVEEALARLPANVQAMLAFKLRVLAELEGDDIVEARMAFEAESGS